MFIALSWFDLQGAHSVVGMIIIWNDGIKAAKALLTDYANFALVVAFWM